MMKNLRLIFFVINCIELVYQDEKKEEKMKKKGLCYEKNIWQLVYNFNFYINFKVFQIKNILFYNLKVLNIDKYIYYNYII